MEEKDVLIYRVRELEVQLREIRGKEDSFLGEEKIEAVGEKAFPFDESSINIIDQDPALDEEEKDYVETPKQSENLDSERKVQYL